MITSGIMQILHSAIQIYEIGYAVDCPEEHLFKIGSGNNTGIIGYDYPNNGNSDFLFPKSAQLKSLSKISKTTYRIFLLLSKGIGDECYNTIEYEIKPGIFSKIKEYLSEEIKIIRNNTDTETSPA